MVSSSSSSTAVMPGRQRRQRVSSPTTGVYSMIVLALLSSYGDINSGSSRGKHVVHAQLADEFLNGDLPVTCDVCVPYLTETRSCLRTCSNTAAFRNNATINLGEWYLGDDSDSLLQQCLDDDRGNQDASITPYQLVAEEGIDITNFVVDETTGETIDLTTLKDRGIAGLVNCCSDADGFEDANCIETFEQTEFCISACISPCVIQTTASYFSCIVDNSPPPAGNGMCDQAQCVEQLVQSISQQNVGGGGGLTGLNGDPNNVQLDGQQIFSFQSLSELSFAGLNGFGDNTGDGVDGTDCALLTPFVTSVCTAGGCCAECEDELAATLSCLINDVVITFSQLEAGEDISFEDCTITSDCTLQLDDGSRRNERRLLDDGPSFVRDVVKGRNLATEEEELAAVEQATEICTEQFTVDVIVYNHTYATERLSDCIFQETINLLGPNVTDPTPAPSGGVSVAVGSLAVSAAVVLFTVAMEIIV